MSNITHYQALKSIHKNDVCWKILRMDLASFFLAYVDGLFKDNTDVPREEAQANLEGFITRLRHADDMEGDGTAKHYLYTWIKEGYLREIDGYVIKTAACDQALRYAASLDDITMATTKSRLAIVQEQIRTLSVETNPDINKRIDYYLSQRNQIDAALKKLRGGVIDTLPDFEILERLREIIALTQSLPQDFRRIVEEMRGMDKDLREKMIISEDKRGEVVEMFLNKNDLISNSEAGQAFDGFYQLLSDTTQRTSISEQITQILSLTPANKLTDNQKQSLKYLFRDLNRESAHVRKTRKVMSKKLNAYIKRDGLSLQKSVNERLATLEKIGLLLSKEDVSMRAPTRFIISTGSAPLRSPVRTKLSPAQNAIDANNIGIETNTGDISDDALTSLSGFSIEEITQRCIDTLRTQNKPMTVSDIIHQNPLTTGIEELITYVRVAIKYNATESSRKQTVTLSNQDGQQLTTQISTFVLSLGNFKDII